MAFNMNKYLKAFFQRGLAFGGFGPIIAGIVFLCISTAVDDFSLTAPQAFLAIVSTYILAFVQAGVSIFNQIESWPIAKSLLCHMGSVYVAYIFCYLVNFWIPLKISVILIFTAIFLVAYLSVWFIVFLAVKATSKKINEKLEK